MYNHLGDNVVINQAGRAIEIIRRPVVVGVAGEVGADQVIDELPPRGLDARGLGHAGPADHLVGARCWSGFVCGA